MKRVAGGTLLLLVGMALLAPAASAQGAQPKLKGKGTVEPTSLEPGTILTVDLQVSHADGWQHIQTVDVNLELKNNVLDQIVITPTTTSISVLGGSAPSSLGQEAKLRSTYFEVNPAKVSLTAQGNQLKMTVPVGLHAAPPPGATLTFGATAVPIETLGPRTLTEPVEENTGFSWGTLGLAIGLALFLGAFVGNIFAGRRKPSARPSIYAAVEKRMAEEKAKR